MIGRRTFLAGLFASLPLPVLAKAPDTVRPPVLRRATTAALPPGSAAGKVVSDLSARTGFCLIDLDTQEMLDSFNPELALPPASVIKALTAAYAREALGPAHRFRTRLLATGPMVEGIVQGDLFLQGDGDPELDTDELGLLAERAAAAGLRGLTGQFHVDGSLLPCPDEIDPTQPAYLGYNPAICGVNLNFNRVYFEWKKTGTDYDLVLEARDVKHRPAVDFVSIAAEERGAPVFAFERSGTEEHWSVARSALGKEGGRWLPVRQPEAYVGEVFHDVAAAYGLKLPMPTPAPAPQDAHEIAVFESKPLDETLHWMLKYSNNLTAEVMGLSATRARGVAATSLRDSAQAMGAWCAEALGVEGLDLYNHSGLSDETHLTATQMARALAHPLARHHLKDLLKPYGQPEGGVSVLAKTGTLNFAAGLAGYVEGPRRKLAFAIFCADLDRRAKLRPEEMEHPRGGKAWLNRARSQEGNILKHWRTAFA